VFIVASFVLLIMAAGTWLLLPKAKRVWHTWEARKLSKEGTALLDAGQPQKAFELLAQAVRKAPNDPLVTRSIARCLDEFPGAEKSAFRAWNQLQHLGAATWEDTVAMGQAALRCSDLARALQIEASLPESCRQERQTREFRAAVLQKSGKVAEAKEMRLAIWREHRDDPECRVKLAADEINSRDKATRDAATDILWEAARGEGKLNVIALTALALSTSRDSSKLAELAELASKAPAFNDMQRYWVFEQCVTKSPELLDTIIPLAKKLATTEKKESRELFYQWISRHNKSDIVLSEISESEALGSRGLFLARANALMRRGQWESLERMLDSRPLPVSKVDLELIRAFLARNLKEGGAMLGHLNGAILYASGNNKASELAQVGAGAESLGQVDVALTAYWELAEMDSPARLPTLRRIYELSERRRDAAGMLKAANVMLKLEPAWHSSTSELDYLRLISGMEMDQPLGHFLHEKDDALQQDPEPIALLSKALAEFYAGDIQGMKRSLGIAANHSMKLEPGPKAVLAGLLWKAGKREEAAAIARDIVAAEMFEEERRYLSPIKLD
jgi:hypothetical protein